MSLNIMDITLAQIMSGIGAGVLIFGGIVAVLYLISCIINWNWWKKENREDFSYFRYFLKHKEEIKKYIENMHAREPSI